MMCSFAVLFLMESPSFAQDGDLAFGLAEIVAESGPHFYRLAVTSTNFQPRVGVLTTIPNDQNSRVNFETCSGERFQVEFSLLRPTDSTCENSDGAYWMAQEGNFWGTLDAETVIYGTTDDFGIAPIGVLAGFSVDALEIDGALFLEFGIAPLNAGGTNPAYSVQVPVNQSDFVYSENGAYSVIIRDADMSAQISRAFHF